MSRLLLILALFASPAALASEPAPPPSPPSMGGGEGGDSDPDMEFMSNFSEISVQLGLTEPQPTAIRDRFYTSQKEVMKALDAHLAAEGAMKKNRVKLMIDLRKNLSTEQWKKLDAMRGQRAGGGGGGGGGRGGHGGPGGGQQLVGPPRGE